MYIWDHFVDFMEFMLAVIYEDWTTHMNSLLDLYKYFMAVIEIGWSLCLSA